MGIDKEELQKRLLATFKVEAEEHFHAISSGLLELEQGNTDILETIFREAHSLKGAARAVNLTEIERLCQSMESVFSDLKQHRLEITGEVIDSLHRTIAMLNDLLLSQTQTPMVSPAAKAERTDQDRDRTRRFESDRLPREAGPAEKTSGKGMGAAAAQTAVMDTVRVAVKKLDSILLQTEEFVTEKAVKSQQTSDMAEIYNQLRMWKKEWSKIRSEVRSIQSALQQNGNGSRSALSPAAIKRVIQFLEWNKDFFESLDYETMKLAQSLRRSQRAFDGMVDSLLDDVKAVTMLPFSVILESFPPFVREISREKGKEAILKIRGETIEVDRRILEALKDPLLHLLRNCVDHGIETPEVRKSRKKPARGTIAIDVSYREGRHVEVLVSDDGGGVDVEAVKAKAVRQGLLEPDEAATHDEKKILPLVFQSGISTSAMVTDLSGRGLGLAIVREKVERLRGEITVETQCNTGTTFRMLLPMTIATFRGTIVQLENHKYIIPSNAIERALNISLENVHTVENQETINYMDTTIPLIRLASILEIPQHLTHRESSRSVNAVVLAAENQKIAFEVDEILEDREILVKPLGPQLERVRNIAGATVLGSGSAVPVLNVSDLMQSAVSGRAGERRTVDEIHDRDRSVSRSILVVEDSITSRILLKTILESSGYTVVTAVDGIDGFSKLQEGRFDLVVTDVDMPGMNGFTLTEKIRKSQQYAGMPVVLVTALESREDRERGIDVGASAYIVKSSFDQSNLLETVQRLIQ